MLFAEHCCMLAVLLWGMLRRKPQYFRGAQERGAGPAASHAACAR